LIDVFRRHRARRRRNRARKSEKKARKAQLTMRSKSMDVPCGWWIAGVNRRANQGCGDVSDCGRSGFGGRRTLEECGPNVVVRCNNVVLTWLVNARSLD
jgi:hypothetical protein